MNFFIATFCIFFLLSSNSKAQFNFYHSMVSSKLSFPNGNGPYGSGGSVVDGHLTVNSGQVHTVVAGNTYDYKSITINSGGSINISGKGIVLLASVGQVIINGTITSDKWADCNTGSFSITEPLTLLTHSFPRSQAAGGGGGRGGGYYVSTTVQYFSVGGVQNCGVGGGGAGGNGYNTSTGPTYIGGNGGSASSGVTPGGSVSGAGGTISTSTTNGTAGTSTAGGTGGNGASGGGGGARWNTGGGGGGGGGQRGLHSNSLIIKTNQSVQGSGSINLSGTNGGNGGNGGSSHATLTTGNGPGGGGGGGGGSGGSGGHFLIYSKTASTFPLTSVNIAGGGAGSGGTAGPSKDRYGTNRSATTAQPLAVNGSSGTTGSVGSKELRTW